jgi:predicted DCC family thiol-disulfide oxidoreductase YuxK
MDERHWATRNQQRILRTIPLTPLARASVSANHRLAIVLFDGTCNICSRTVQFIIRRERDHEMKFASIQSDVGVEIVRRVLGERGEALLRDLMGTNGAPLSVVFLDGEEVYTYSTAALRIGVRLRAPWCWFASALRLLPRSVLDLAYRLFARRRFRWFGRSESCPLPTVDLEGRLL